MVKHTLYDLNIHVTIGISVQRCVEIFDTVFGIYVKDGQAKVII